MPVPSGRGFYSEKHDSWTRLAHHRRRRLRRIRIRRRALRRRLPAARRPAQLVAPECRPAGTDATTRSASHSPSCRPSRSAPPACSRRSPTQAARASSRCSPGASSLAALVLWALVAWRRPAMPPLPVALGALALGGIGYAGEATLYFSALERLDASLVAMLLATYPVLVVAAAVALGRERPDRRRAIALATAIAGAALVLGGAQIGALSGPGLMFAGSATVAYASYVLLADRFTARVDGLLLATLVVTGAAIGTVTFGASTGSIATARARHLRLGLDRHARAAVHGRADRVLPLRPPPRGPRHREHPVDVRDRRRRRPRRAAARRVARRRPGRGRHARRRRRDRPAARHAD